MPVEFTKSLASDLALALVVYIATEMCQEQCHKILRRGGSSTDLFSEGDNVNAGIWSCLEVQIGEFQIQYPL